MNHFKNQGDQIHPFFRGGIKVSLAVFLIAGFSNNSGALKLLQARGKDICRYAFFAIQELVVVFLSLEENIPKNQKGPLVPECI